MGKGGDFRPGRKRLGFFTENRQPPPHAHPRRRFTGLDHSRTGTGRSEIRHFAEICGNTFDFGIAIRILQLPRVRSLCTQLGRPVQILRVSEIGLLRRQHLTRQTGQLIEQVVLHDAPRAFPHPLSQSVAEVVPPGRSRRDKGVVTEVHRLPARAAVISQNPPESDDIRIALRRLLIMDRTAKIEKVPFDDETFAELFMAGFVNRPLPPFSDPESESRETTGQQIIVKMKRPSGGRAVIGRVAGHESAVVTDVVEQAVMNRRPVDAADENAINRIGEFAADELEIAIGPRRRIPAAAGGYDPGFDGAILETAPPGPWRRGAPERRIDTANSTGAGNPDGRTAPAGRDTVERDVGTIDDID